MQQTSYACKFVVNDAPLYDVVIARVEVHGGTCFRRATPFGLRRTHNDKVATGLLVEQQSHRGL